MQVVKVVIVFFFFHFLLICYPRLFSPPPSLSFTAVVINSRHSLLLQYVSALQYMWLLDVRGDKGALKGYVRGAGVGWGDNEADGGMKRSLGRSTQEKVFLLSQRVKVELSFCCRPRRFARAGGCSNSSDKLAPVTRSSAF